MANSPMKAPIPVKTGHASFSQYIQSGEVLCEYMVGNLLFISGWVEIPQNVVTLIEFDIAVKNATYSFGRDYSGNIVPITCSASYNTIRYNGNSTHSAISATTFSMWCDMDI